MGSLMEACCLGFVCRLCSKMNRKVVFIYGAEGLEHNLLEKINSYLPIEISEDDELPKTICDGCMVKILLHHRLIVQIQTAQKRFVKMREDEQAARSATAAESNTSSRTLSAESTASSRTMSVDSTDAVEGSAERQQATEPYVTETPGNSSVHAAANECTPNQLTNDPANQDAPAAVVASSTGSTSRDQNVNNDRTESGPSSKKPAAKKPAQARLKRKRNPSRAAKVPRRRYT